MKLVLMPTGSIPPTTPPTILRQIVCGLVFFVIFATGLIMGVASQASSPNYKALFWSVAPFAMVHFSASGVYFLMVSGWRRWVAVTIGALAGCSFAEFALRVL